MPGYILSIDEDANGNLWFGAFNSNIGVSRFDGTTFTTFIEITKGTRKLRIHSDGTIYVGGNDGGLTLYNGTAFTFYTEEDRLSINPVRSKGTYFLKF